MAKRPIQFVPPKQARQLTELAERARLSLSRFAGVDVEYNAVGLQLLDEWVDRHLRQFPKPSGEIITIWGAFLGETFRRRFNGEWAVVTATGKPHLGVLCPKDEQGRVMLDSRQEKRRNKND